MNLNIPKYKTLIEITSTIRERPSLSDAVSYIQSLGIPLDQAYTIVGNAIEGINSILSKDNENQAKLGISWYNRYAGSMGHPQIKADNIKNLTAEEQKMIEQALPKLKDYLLVIKEAKTAPRKIRSNTETSPPRDVSDSEFKKLISKLQNGGKLSKLPDGFFFIKNTAKSALGAASLILNAFKEAVPGDNYDRLDDSIKEYNSYAEIMGRVQIESSGDSKIEPKMREIFETEYLKLKNDYLSLVEAETVMRNDTFKAENPNHPLFRKFGDTNAVQASNTGKESTFTKTVKAENSGLKFFQKFNNAIVNFFTKTLPSLFIHTEKKYVDVPAAVQENNASKKSTFATAAKALSGGNSEKARESLANIVTNEQKQLNNKGQEQQNGQSNDKNIKVDVKSHNMSQVEFSSDSESTYKTPGLR